MQKLLAFILSLSLLLPNLAFSDKGGATPLEVFSQAISKIAKITGMPETTALNTFNDYLHGIGVSSHQVHSMQDLEAKAPQLYHALTKGKLSSLSVLADLYYLQEKNQKLSTEEQAAIDFLANPDNFTEPQVQGSVIPQQRQALWLAQARILMEQKFNTAWKDVQRQVEVASTKREKTRIISTFKERIDRGEFKMAALNGELTLTVSCAVKKAPLTIRIGNSFSLPFSLKGTNLISTNNYQSLVPIVKVDDTRFKRVGFITPENLNPATRRRLIGRGNYFDKVLGKTEVEQTRNFFQQLSKILTGDALRFPGNDVTYIETQGFQVIAKTEDYNRARFLRNITDFRRLVKNTHVFLSSQFSAPTLGDIMETTVKASVLSFLAGESASLVAPNSEAAVRLGSMVIALVYGIFVRSYNGFRRRKSSPNPNAHKIFMSLCMYGIPVALARIWMYEGWEAFNLLDDGLLTLASATTFAVMNETLKSKWDKTLDFLAYLNLNQHALGEKSSKEWVRKLSGKVGVRVENIQKFLQKMVKEPLSIGLMGLIATGTAESIAASTAIQVLSAYIFGDLAFHLFYQSSKKLRRNPEARKLYQLEKNKYTFFNNPKKWLRDVYRPFFKTPLARPSQAQCLQDGLNKIEGLILQSYR